MATAVAISRSIASARWRVRGSVMVPSASSVSRETTTTVGETTLQVPMHTVYHRGQVNARVRALGGEPPLVDYIAWLWLGRPAPEWPVIAVEAP